MGSCDCPRLRSASSSGSEDLDDRMLPSDPAKRFSTIQLKEKSALIPSFQLRKFLQKMTNTSITRQPSVWSETPYHIATPLPEKTYSGISSIYIVFMKNTSLLMFTTQHNNHHHHRQYSSVITTALAYITNKSLFFS